MKEDMLDSKAINAIFDPSFTFHRGVDVFPPSDDLSRGTPKSGCEVVKEEEKEEISNCNPTHLGSKTSFTRGREKSVKEGEGRACRWIDC